MEKDLGSKNELQFESTVARRVRLRAAVEKEALKAEAFIKKAAKNDHVRRHRGPLARGLANAP